MINPTVPRQKVCNSRLRLSFFFFWFTTTEVVLKVVMVHPTGTVLPTAFCELVFHVFKSVNNYTLKVFHFWTVYWQNRNFDFPKKIFFFLKFWRKRVQRFLALCDKTFETNDTLLATMNFFDDGSFRNVQDILSMTNTFEGQNLNSSKCAYRTFRKNLNFSTPRFFCCHKIFLIDRDSLTIFVPTICAITSSPKIQKCFYNFISSAYLPE